MYFLKLIRYKNLIMVFLTMVFVKYGLITSSIKETYLSHFEFLILAISIVMITAGGYIINDIYDIENDRINKINKLFVSVSIPLKNAWYSYFISTLVGLILGIYISFTKNLAPHSSYFIITVLSLFLYSKYLKNTVLIGNILVSTLCALVIYLVYSFDFRINKTVFLEDLSIGSIHKLQFGQAYIKFYILFSFLTTLVREIIKDIEDINGDLQVKAKTLPIVIGRKRASRVAFFFTGTLFISLIIMIKFLQSNVTFLLFYVLFLLLPLLYFMYLLWLAKNKKDFSKLSNLMKIIMLIGITSMLLFKL